MSATAPDQFLFEVNCACCRRLIGVSNTRKWGIVCDLLCAWDFPASMNEDRDAVLEVFAKETSLPVKQVAEMFGFSRQHAYQSLDKRDIAKQAHRR